MPRYNSLILFRIDASGHDGALALERSLLLARTHLRRGGRAHFVLSEGARLTRTRIEASGLTATSLSAPHGSADDARAFLSIASHMDARSAIVAGPGFGKNYVQALSSAIFTAVLCDGSGRFLPAQLLISGNFAADEQVDTRRADTQVLLGPRYQIVDPDLTDWQRPERSCSGDRTRIFITSSDDHISSRIVDALPRPQNTEIISLLGDFSCPMLDQAARSACRRGYIVQQITRATKSDALLLADSAIISSDAITGLVGFSGLPTLLLSIDQADRRETLRLAEEGATMPVAPLSEISRAALERTLEDFLLDEPQRRRFGQRIAALVDGRGAERILGKMNIAHDPGLQLLKAA